MDLTSLVVPKWAKFAALAAAVAFLLTLTYCEGRKAGENAVEVEQLEDDLETLEDLGTANEAAGEQRLEDSDELRNQQEELQDARTVQGDDAGTRRLRSLCLRLRQQGGDPRDVAACHRFEGEP